MKTKNNNDEGTGSNPQANLPTAETNFVELFHANREKQLWEGHMGEQILFETIGRLKSVAKDTYGFYGAKEKRTAIQVLEGIKESMEQFMQHMKREGK